MNAATTPGDTVDVATGAYAPFTVTASGTSAAPITIKGTKQFVSSGLSPYTSITSSSVVPITVSGASYVNVDLIQTVENGNFSGIVVSNSSHVTLDSDGAEQNYVYSTGAAVSISGGSSDVTVSRTWVTAYSSTGGVVADGGSGDVITTDMVNNWHGPSVVLTGATSSDVTSNEISVACGAAISITAGSSAASVQNNIGVIGGFASAPSPECGATVASERVLVVDSSSTSGTTVDYNDFNAVPSTVPDVYSWAGADYVTPAAFTAATGQGAHDVGSTASAYAIDSANSAAPGELSTDIYGNPRVDDPKVPDSGVGPVTYHDRGPVEVEEPLTIYSYAASSSQAPTGGTLTFTATASSAWSKTVTYLFDFGDGSTQTNTTGVATHSYAATGSYTTSVTVSGYTGTTVSKTYLVKIVPPAPLVPTMTLTSAGTMTAVATAVSTDSWDVATYTYDFGDGSAPVTEGVWNGPIVHHYSALGTYTVELTAVDVGGNSTTVSQQFTTAGSRYTAYGPVRVLDTRHGIGTGGTVAKLDPNQALRLKIAGNGAIPANATAVAFNLTVTNPSSGGYLVAYPDGQPRPATSNLNFTPGLTKATSVLVGVGSDGYVSLYNGSAGSVDLVADATGYFTQTNAAGYTPLLPARILDTRKGTGTGGVRAQIGSGKTLTLTIAGADSGALPATGITAVALNLTAVDEAAGGYVTAYPDGSSAPTTSSLNFSAGQVVPNTVFVPVGADGEIDLYNGSGGPIDLVADVEGYFSANGPDAYLPVAPVRLFDSRTQGGAFYNNGPFAYTTLVGLRPLGANPVISFSDSTVAYVFNATVTQTVGSGYVTVYPDNGQSPPLTSNVNFSAGQTTANTAITAGATIDGSDNATITFTLNPSSTQLIMDLFGYFSAQ